jgi:hypothetical protein
MNVPSPDFEPPDGLTSLTELCRQERVTYRQGNYWANAGFVTLCFITSAGHPTTPGSGHHAVLTPDEALVFRRMARLIHAGWTPAAAADVARTSIKVAAQMGQVTVQVSNAVYVTFDVEEGEEAEGPVEYVHLADWTGGDDRRVCQVSEYAAHEGECR